MQVRRFSDEYDAVAPLHGMSPDELRDRDRLRSKVDRWIADEGGVVAASVSASTRPDARVALRFAGDALAVYGPLTEAASRAMEGTLIATLDEDDGDRIAALRLVGFVPEVVAERFTVAFDAVLARVGRAWTPSGYALRPVVECDLERTLALDDAIRNLVPGTDGWTGSVDAFAAELASPEMDPSAYLIAIDEATGDYAGLIRFWRNPGQPRLGLLGVLPEHRSRPVAAALLEQATRAASTWGSPTFETETSTANAALHRRLSDLAAERRGRFVQLRFAD